jgi:uncharacterized protein
MCLFGRQQINATSIMPTPMLKSALYAPATSGIPVLHGGRCVCGYTFFPMQTFGCERCGRTGDDLQPIELSGCGTLVATAAVYVHSDRRRPTPFVIGTVALDDGPVIRTLLTEAPPAHNKQSVRVAATLVPVESTEGGAALDLRFRTAARMQQRLILDEQSAW